MYKYIDTFIMLYGFVAEREILLHLLNAKQVMTGEPDHHRNILS